MLTGKDDLKQICINPSEPLRSQPAGESCTKDRFCRAPSRRKLRRGRFRGGCQLPTLAITLLRVCPWPPWERRSSGNRNPAPTPDCLRDKPIVPESSSKEPERRRSW